MLPGHTMAVRAVVAAQTWSFWRCNAYSMPHATLCLEAHVQWRHQQTPQPAAQCAWMPNRLHAASRMQRNARKSASSGKSTQHFAYRYFLSRFRKVKKANGQILAVNEVGAICLQRAGCVRLCWRLCQIFVPHCCSELQPEHAATEVMQ